MGGKADFECEDCIHRGTGKNVNKCVGDDELAEARISVHGTCYVGPGPLGKQVRPVLVGRKKNGDIIIQANGSHVRIDAEHVQDLPAAIMLAASSG